MRNLEFGIKRAVFRTPLGWVGVAASEQGICRVVLPKKNKKSVVRDLESDAIDSGPASPLLAKAVMLLTRYFSGESVSFDLPLDLRYYTPFQQAVWKVAAAVPSGETRSYGWIAKRIKNPKAARAVGQALGANPVPIFIPCHRVVSSTGTLCGFSGGLEMKKKLLELEKGKVGR